MFFRSKPAGSYRYLQIVHSVREGKKVRQQVIATLGRLDLLEASGQLERLMRSGLRHCESFAVIDAHAAGEIEPVAIRRIGPDLVFARLWKESGIPEVFRSLIKARDYEFDVERAIYLSVLHRLFASVHKYLRISDLCKELAFGTQRADRKNGSSYNSFAFSMLCRQFLESGSDRAAERWRE